VVLVPVPVLRDVGVLSGPCSGSGSSGSKWAFLRLFFHARAYGRSSLFNNNNNNNNNEINIFGSIL